MSDNFDWILELKPNDIFYFSIPNWEKYQGTDDAKRKRQWIRLDLHWDNDPLMRTLNPGGHLLWLALLGHRASANQPKAKQPARQQILAHLREWSHRLREDCNSGPSKLSAEFGGHKTAVFVTPKTWPKELQKRSYRLQLVGGCQELQQG